MNARSLLRNTLPALMFALCALCPACSNELTYSADAISADVFDEDTKQPIAGVSVVAGWELQGGIEGFQTVGWFKILETVTDADGRFSFPSWGPETRDSSRGALLAGTPTLMLFKSGYLYREVRNLSLLEPAPARTTSYWNGKHIGMKRFHGSLSEYSLSVSDPMLSRIESILRRGGCNWKSLPNFLWAVETLNTELVLAKTQHNLRGLQYLGESFPSSCGDLRKYVEEHHQ